MSLQPPPSEAQRCHWYANEAGGGVCDQVPFEAVSVDPCRNVSPIPGGVRFSGRSDSRAEALAASTATRTSAAAKAAGRDGPGPRSPRLLLEDGPIRRRH